jgi:exopolysaccharide biosynthesis polyprenyl glycosylphosphotransferase
MSKLINLLKKNYKGDLYRISARLIFMAEVVAVILSIIISIDTVMYYGGSSVVLTPRIALFAMLIFLSWLALSRISSLSILPRTQRYRTLIFRFFQISFIELIFCILIWLAIGTNSVPFAIIPLYIGLRFILTILVRVVTYRLFKFYRSKGYNTRYVIVIADQFSDVFIERLLEQKEWGFNIKYILSNSKVIKAKFSNRLKIFKENADLKFLLDCDVVDEVIYCKNKVDGPYMKEVIRICEEVGVLFRMQSNLSPLAPAKLQLQTVHMKPYIQMVDSPARRYSIILKNVSDIYFSSIAVMLLSPIFILLALLVKIDSRGPVFFIQERIGLRGRKFNLIKFRTMVKDAASVQHILEKHNEADGPAFKMKYDPRITRIGRILRKTGLDELPQLINVVKGEMSLIGPRPPVAKEVIKYERWQLRRLSVKPGITCTWQVLDNRNSVSFDKWMQLDLQYIDNWTLMDDVKLFFRTFNTIIKATGS